MGGQNGSLTLSQGVSDDFQEERIKPKILKHIHVFQAECWGLGSNVAGKGSHICIVLRNTLEAVSKPGLEFKGEKGIKGWRSLQGSDCKRTCRVLLISRTSS